jgi:hypothetical protein
MLRRIRPQGADVFSVSPSDGSIDPLNDLYAEAEGGPISTSRLGPGVLKAGNSFKLQHDLNEYLVFRKPGSYTLRVESTRVVLPGVRGPLQSSPVEISILPRDEAWSALQFQTARAVLLPLVPEPPGHAGQVVMADEGKREREATRFGI